MGDTPSALLTNSQREYVAGDREHDNATNERKHRSRIRKRVYAGIEQDGIVLGEMDAELRREIFQEWQNRNYEPGHGVDVPNGEAMGPDDLERWHLRAGIEELLGFLYLGVEEGAVGDFETILTDAIDAAVRERGQYVERVDLDVELGDLATADDLRERLAAGDIEPDDLTLREARALLDDGAVDPGDALERLGVEPDDAADGE